MYFYAVNMTWSRATWIDKLNFKIEFELMTLHLKEESAVYSVLTNLLMNENISTQSKAS